MLNGIRFLIEIFIIIRLFLYNIVSAVVDASKIWKSVVLLIILFASLRLRSLLFHSHSLTFARIITSTWPLRFSFVHTATLNTQGSSTALTVETWRIQLKHRITVIIEELLTRLLHNADPPHLVFKQLRALDAVCVIFVVNYHHLALIVFFLLLWDDVQ